MTLDLPTIQPSFEENADYQLIIHSDAYLASPIGFHGGGNTPSVTLVRSRPGGGKQKSPSAVSKPWSNGPVEGHIDRLKMLKRQMYGRAGIKLLRARLLPEPASSDP